MARGGTDKTTSAEVAKKASKALHDGRSSARTKSIAGSALAQVESKGKNKGKSKSKNKNKSKSKNK